MLDWHWGTNIENKDYTYPALLTASLYASEIRVHVRQAVGISDTYVAYQAYMWD